MKRTLDRCELRPRLAKLCADQPHHQRHGDEDRQLQRHHSVDVSGLAPGHVGDVTDARHRRHDESTTQRQHERVTADQQDVERRHHTLATARQVHDQRQQQHVQQRLGVNETRPHPSLPHMREPVRQRRQRQRQNQRQRGRQRLPRRGRRGFRPGQCRSGEQSAGQPDARHVDPAQDVGPIESAPSLTRHPGPLAFPARLSRHRSGSAVACRHRAPLCHWPTFSCRHGPSPRVCSDVDPSTS